MPGNPKEQLETVFGKHTVRTIRGDLGQCLPGKSVFIQASEPGALLAAKSALPLPRQVQGLPLELTVQKLDDDQVVLTEARPSVVAAWHASELPKGKMPAVAESVEFFDHQFQRFLGASSSTREDFKTVLAAGERVQETLLASYVATAQDDAATLNTIARLNREIVDFQRKAQFGDDDNYWPEVYEKMHQHSRSVVAIALKGRVDPVGSGTLIGTNLILTCRHVFEEAATDYEVWFDYEETSRGRLNKMVFPISAIVFEGAAEPTLRNSTLDYVLVEIGAGQDGLESAARGYKPLALTTAPCHIDDPVYVIGHPRGGVRTIHDNARVHFPFHLAGIRKSNLDVRARSEIEEFVTSRFDPGPQRDRMLEDLYRNYQDSFVQDGADFKYVHGLRGPAIGIDSDTYGGDSGAPTCLRRGSDRAAGVIGVLVGGAAQSAARATWLTHEVVLPVSEILSQLDAHLPNWQTRYSVTVQTP